MHQACLIRLEDDFVESGFLVSRPSHNVLVVTGDVTAQDWGWFLRLHTQTSAHINYTCNCKLLATILLTLVSDRDVSATSLHVVFDLSFMDTSFKSRWHHGAVVVSDLGSTGGFNSRLGTRRKYLGQVSHTYVPLSHSSISWYWPKGGYAWRLGR